MYLKQIELQGFKSFPDRTKLTFEKGATVVVGPNGSGKSNIADAMRWVLGEISSKSLRGSKMEDIIFGGSDSRKPMTYAEVSVTFDNSSEYGRIDVPYDEITVTRRYHRSGESEYFINRREVRLRDIYEMFLNTGIGRNGYSIIEQGRIAEIISKKSDDRREIFEDAAGIAKHRHSKNDAERKLDAANQNIERLRDAQTIMQGHLASLQRESIRARRFVEYSEIKKEADVRLWLYDTEKYRRDIAAAEAEGAAADRELEENAEELSGLAAQSDRLEQLLAESRRDASAIVERIRQRTGENHELDAEIRVARTRIDHLTEAAERAGNESRALAGSAEEEKKNAAAREEEAEKLLAEIDRLALEEKRRRDASAASAAEADRIAAALASAFDEVSACRAELSDTEARIELLGRSDTEEETREEGARRDLSEREAAAQAHEAECGESEERIRQYEIRQLTLEGALAKERAQAETLTASRDAADSESRELRVARDTLSGRIEALRRMEEHFEGYQGSVRAVMRAVREGSLSPDGRIYGPVSSVISVDGRYVTAVETALGQQIQNIIVENEETAHAAIYWLRRNNAGCATFYPLTSVRGSAPTREMEIAAGCRGYIGVASELCSCDGKFKNILSSMLGRTVVFDTLENATAMAKKTGYSVRAVTADGQLINRGGSFTGGSVRAGSGILTRADDIRRMEGDLAATDKRLSETVARAEKLDKELGSLEARIGTMDSERLLVEKLAAVERAKLEKQRETLRADRELLEKIRGDLAASDSEKEARGTELESLRARRRELSQRADELDAYRLEAETRRNAAAAERERLSEEAAALTVRISEARRDVESLRALAALSREKSASLLADSEARKAERESALASQEELRAHLDECLSALAEGSGEIEELNRTRAGEEDKGLDYERRL
ncbi:MAG: chromosome segregation protein SMC, partial [Clostridia bacterium]|nr:chromosome segregation protein SMC [Clostridia bacterium]